MSKKEKYYYITAAVVVVIVIIVAIYHGSHKAAAPAQTAQTSTGQNMATSTASSTAASTTTPKSSSANLTYEQAVAMYPNRVQFSQCQVNINGSHTLAIRQGQKFMLDNRDKTSHVITADSHSVKLAGYGFAIFTASTLGTSNITCDGANRATMDVEK